jgi:hypothetical protein
MLRPTPQVCGKVVELLWILERLGDGLPGFPTPEEGL